MKFLPLRKSKNILDMWLDPNQEVNIPVGQASNNKLQITCLLM